LAYPLGWPQTTPLGVVFQAMSVETENKKGIPREDLSIQPMHSILIAHRNVAFAEELATQLRASGNFTIVTCPGPWPPQRCIRCDIGYCPLTEGADLMIYDPQLTAPDAEGRVHSLAVDSARAHPDVPMLLAWSSNSVPDAGTLRAIRAQAPHVQVAAHEPAALVRQIQTLIGAPVRQLEVMT
jgi:hypothetical protein